MARGSVLDIAVFPAPYCPAPGRRVQAALRASHAIGFANLATQCHLA